MLGGRRWGGPKYALDRAKWKGLETNLLQRVLRRKAAAVQRGHFMMRAFSGAPAPLLLLFPFFSVRVASVGATGCGQAAASVLRMIRAPVNRCAPCTMMNLPAHPPKCCAARRANDLRIGHRG